MPVVNDIYQNINEFAPFSSAAEWDNVGLLLGSLKTEVTGCVISLDATDAAVNTALDLGANLIVTHHPVIFQPLRAIYDNSVVSRLARHQISVISAHTNLDLARGGVNDALCEALNLQEVVPFLNKDNLGRIGVLRDDMEITSFASYVKRYLSAHSVTFTPANRPIRRVAVVSGSGGDYLAAAITSGADALLTGEAKHHEIIAAINAEFPLVIAGHHDTEAVVLKSLSMRLSTAFPQVDFRVHNEFPVHVVS